MSYNEIRTTISKKDCECTGCKKRIKKDDNIVINPKNKEVYCQKCGHELKPAKP